MCLIAAISSIPFNVYIHFEWNLEESTCIYNELLIRIRMSAIFNGFEIDRGPSTIVPLSSAVETL